MTLTQLAPRTMEAALAASVMRDPKGAVVVLRGEADAFTLPVLVDALISAIAEYDGVITVDLAHTEFIDSATSRALFRASQFLQARGRTLTVRAPTRAAARVLGLLGLSSLIEPNATTL